MNDVLARLDHWGLVLDGDVAETCRRAAAEIRQWRQSSPVFQSAARLACDDPGDPDAIEAEYRYARAMYESAG